MILKLRQHHRRIFSALALLLPLLFGLGIAARRRVPQHESLPPPEPSSLTQTFTATGFERDDLFEKSPVRVRLWRDHESGALAVGLSSSKDFLKPDLMVYWSGGPVTSGTLPPEAKLLGVFVATTLVLPAEASTTDGRLILFSLADQEIVDVSKPVQFSDSTI